MRQKAVKIVAALEPPIGCRWLRFLPRARVCFFFILIHNFCKLTVLALKRFLVVEKEQNAYIFHFKTCSFCWRGRKKYYLPPYTTVIGWD